MSRNRRSSLVSKQKARAKVLKRNQKVQQQGVQGVIPNNLLSLTDKIKSKTIRLMGDRNITNNFHAFTDMH